MSKAKRGQGSQETRAALESIVAKFCELDATILPDRVTSARSAAMISLLNHVRNSASRRVPLASNFSWPMSAGPIPTAIFSSAETVPAVGQVISEP